MNADQLRSLQPALAALLAHFRRCFVSEPTFRHLQAYVLGLLADLKRKSVEPIALAAGVAVRTLQEFLSLLSWDHQRGWGMLQRLVMDRHASDEAIGIIDGSAHVKQGKKTPGVQRQWCGEKGKVENCVVGEHLLYTDNDPKNPFSCVIASDLYLPKSWADDRPRCREAKIPDDVVYRPKWLIAIAQVIAAIGNGMRFSWLTFDEEYGSVPRFWFELDRLGQRAIGEVRANFLVWPSWPHYQSAQAAHAAKRVDNVCRHSPVFRGRGWHRLTVKETTRGPAVWELKAGRVHLVDTRGAVSRPTDRQYWLLVIRNVKTGEHKYLISNAAGGANWKQMMRATFARWHVEKWFERAKQEAGFGAFEVRTYCGLLRHWFCAALAMYFLAAETQRLRGEIMSNGHGPADHAGAGGGGDERDSSESMEPLVALVG
jgi:SRSO17 transposase